MDMQNLPYTHTHTHAHTDCCTVVVQLLHSSGIYPVCLSENDVNDQSKSSASLLKTQN